MFSGRNLFTLPIDMLCQLTLVFDMVMVVFFLIFLMKVKYMCYMLVVWCHMSSFRCQVSGVT